MNRRQHSSLNTSKAKSLGVGGEIPSSSIFVGMLNLDTGEFRDARSLAEDHPVEGLPAGDAPAELRAAGIEPDQIGGAL